MIISGIQSIQNVYRTPLAQENSTTRLTEPLNDRTMESDTVHISEKANELALKDQAEKKGQEKIITGQPDAGISDKDLPLEAYSLPGWYGDLSTIYNKVDQKLSVPYPDTIGALRDKLSPREKDEVFEYSGTLSKYFREEVKALGIETTEDYYKSIVQNKEMSELLHQAVRQRLANDSRAMELMQKFGVS